MASDRDQWADNLSGESSGGWLTGFLADEDQFDRRSLWRLGSWGFGSVTAVVVALLANQYSIGWRREQVASADLVRQAQQIQWIAKESQDETRRLASAIDTLNSDRDRLYSRVTVLEQGLDTVTGSIGRQSAASASEAPTSTPTISTPSPASPSTASVPSTSQPPAAPPAAELIGPPKPAAAAVPTVSQSGAPPAGSPSPSVAQNTTPSSATAASKTTAAATADKASTAAALPPDPPPAAPPAPPQPVVSVARSETANNASAAAITPSATATAAPVTAAPSVSTAPLMPSKSILAPPDPAAAKLIEPDPSITSLPLLPPPQTIAAAPGMTEPDAGAAQAPAVAVQRTEFGIDLGGANSIDGLRALWRGLLKYRSNKALADLRPIIVVRERSSGLGMQLRLVAGPLSDAAAAAKICATLTESSRSCETTVFDGQRLALKNDNGADTDNGVKSDGSTKAEGSAPAAAVSNGHPAAASGRSLRRRGSSANGAKIEEPEKPPPTKSSLTSFWGLR